MVVSGMVWRGYDGKNDQRSKRFLTTGDFESRISSTSINASPLLIALQITPMLRTSLFGDEVLPVRLAGWIVFEDLPHVSIGVVGTFRKRELSVECATAAVVRADQPNGTVVADTAGGIPGARRVRRLFDLGGVSGDSLSLRAVPVSVLFAGIVRR